MKRLLFIGLFLISGIAEARRWEADGVVYDCDDELSFKVFTNFNFSGLKQDFSGKTICGSTFTQELPDSVVFPEKTEKLRLVYCHIENVVLPEGTVVVNPDCGGVPCWTEPFKVQNDLEDWKIDERGDPVEPVRKEEFQKLGISTDPEDIPREKLEEPITERKRREDDRVGIGAIEVRP